MDHPFHGLYLATVCYAWLSGLVPFLNCEVYLVWLAASAPRQELGGLVLAATAGQMLAKSLLYWGGRGLLRLPLGPLRRLCTAPATAPRAFATGGAGRAGLVFASASTGIPPLYGLSAACGAWGWSFSSFLLFGTLGRLARFSALMLVPASLAHRMPGPWTIAGLAVAVALLPACTRAWRARPGRAASGLAAAAPGANG